MADRSEGPAAKRSKLEIRDKDGLVSSLSRLVESMESVVKEGEKDCREARGIEDYIRLESPRSMKLMFKPMPVYAQCMIEHNVTTWKDFEDIVKKHYKDEGVRELVEELLSAEDGYKHFVEKREKELATLEKENSLRENEIITVGQTVPRNLTLTEAQSGNSVSLISYCEKSEYTLFILMRHYG